LLLLKERKYLLKFNKISDFVIIAKILLTGKTNKNRGILFIIIISQIACASLWFAGNAVMPDLIKEFNLNDNLLGHLTSAVQFGFIVGTLFSAMLTISDRFSPSKVFFTSAIAGAISNVLLAFGHQSQESLLFLRFTTGLFLAGIYPIGMKIASDYNEKGLGKALGYLVGALVLGTAFPHLLKSLTNGLPWKYVIIFVSGLSVIGGLIILFFVPDGPYRTKSAKINLKAFFKVFKGKEFRSAAFGYFGHMWELYTFWAFVPVILLTYTRIYTGIVLNIPELSFIIIGAGFLSCIFGGYLSQLFGSRKIAFIALLCSGICCLISPFAFSISFPLFLAFLIFWGMAVVADSPQFSALVAYYAPVEFKGTALTIVNCIGFSITIISIQVLNVLTGKINPEYIYLILAIGPVFGLTVMYKASSKNRDGN